MLRNSQPEILVEDAGEGPRVLATISLQFGQVVDEFTKPTSIEYFARIADRAVRKGDILIAMDGDGSIGKTAVFLEDYEAVCDSHVAIARVKPDVSSMALSCFLNSSYGQAQIARQISGATGQVQVSQEDLVRLHIPRIVLERGPRIAELYATSVRGFTSSVMRVRRALCNAAARFSGVLGHSGCFNKDAAAMMARSTDPSYLLEQLARLKPRMF